MINPLKTDSKLRIESWKCVNPRHRSSRCTICADNCPVGAVTLNGDGPRVDRLKCTGCGICCSLCPDEVFAWNGMDYDSFLGEIESFREKERLTIACERADASKVDDPSWRVKCLGGVDRAHLVGIARAGFDTVSSHGTSSCQDCPSKWGGSVFRKHAEEASALLRGMGVTLRVESTQESDLGQRKHTEGENTPDAAASLYSRREFFNSFKERVNLLRTEEGDLPDGSAKIALRKFNPIRRRFLSRTLRELTADERTPPAEMSIPLSIPVTNGECDFCQLCVVFCPTEALYTVNPPGSIAIRLDADRCTGCGLCVTACPQGSVELEPTCSVHSLIAEEPVLLVERKLNICTECGGEFVPGAGTPTLCKKCQTEKAIESFFDDRPLPPHGRVRSGANFVS